MEKWLARRDRCFIGLKELTCWFLKLVLVRAFQLNASTLVRGE